MLDIPGLNKANYNNCVMWNNISGNLTSVGYNGGPSYYKTYDQGGNVKEWIENAVNLEGYGGTDLYAYSRMVAGGSFASTTGEISINTPFYNNVGIHHSGNYNSLTLNRDIGFRVASSTNPLNLPNFIDVNKSEALDYKTPYIFAVDQTNTFFNVIPQFKNSTYIFTTGSMYNQGLCNSLAYNYDKDLVFFIYYDSLNTNSGLYYWNGLGLSAILGKINNSSNYISGSINSADYYASGYWYFNEGSDLLNKVLFSYTGNTPTATGKISWNINLPISSTDNKFGGLAIDKTSGILYAATYNNNNISTCFYSLDLKPTNTGGYPTLMNSGTIILDDNGIVPGVKLAIGNDQTLYGHSDINYGRFDNNWYKINTSTDFGLATKVKTYDNFSDFKTVSFNDITGNNSFIGRSINSIFKIGALEVTNQEYCNFLNIVDPSGLTAYTGENIYNQYNQLVTPSIEYLYHNIMNSIEYGGIVYSKSNLVGSKYVVSEHMQNKPVNYVTFYMAMRYCNWLHNKVDDPNTRNTTTGSYNFNVSPKELSSLSRGLTARYYLPSRREWTAAGYYTLNKLDGLTSSWSHTQEDDGEGGNRNYVIFRSYDEGGGVGSPPTTNLSGWKILNTDKDWSTVTGVNPETDAFIGYKILFSPGLVSWDIDPKTFTFYSDVPSSGWYSYSTQSNAAPSCSDIDTVGSGPYPRIVGVPAVFSDLVPGTKYTAYFSISENSPYTANVSPTRTSFIASSSTEQIMLKVTKYWPMKMMIVHSKLIANDRSPNVHVENNILVKCDHLTNDCEITRTPMPTRTVTKTLTRTSSLTPTPTKTPTISVTRTPPTISATPTITPTISITPTRTPIVTRTVTLTPSITTTITPTITISPSITVTPSTSPP